jgi:[acyl-carrier-protein] S-malonyltransferase
MLPAEGPFAAFLAGVDMTPPRLRLYLNATGAPADTVDEIRGALVRQLRNPVRWIDDVKGLIADGVTRFVEVGPGKILRGTLRRIWPDASAYEVHSVCDLASLRRLAEACRA